MRRPPPRSTLFPYTTLFRSEGRVKVLDFGLAKPVETLDDPMLTQAATMATPISEVGQTVGTLSYMAPEQIRGDRKSTRLNSSHLGISYAGFCLKKKKTKSIN